MQTAINRAGWLVAAVLAIAVIAAVATIARGGPLDPPAAPAPTDATVIDSLPFTISSRGTYVLKRNLIVPLGQDGIHVNADDVTIDLNGFALFGSGNSASGIGIVAGARDLAVRNGAIGYWGCAGLNLDSTIGAHLDHLRLSYNGGFPGNGCGWGMILGYDSSVSDCSIEDNASGILMSYDGGSITNCSLRNGPGTGISVSNATVSNCTVTGFGTAGITSLRSVINNCVLRSNVAKGISATESTITNNVVTGSGTAQPFAAISLNGGNVVTGNTVSDNGTDGISATGDADYISQNTILNNIASGIYVSAGVATTRIDGNTIAGGKWGIFVDGTNNVIVRNNVGFASILRYVIQGANNVVGPFEGLSPAPPLSNPWANIDN